MAEAAANARAFRGGESVRHYRILGLVGAGGMGVVYKALDQQLERTVALKFLPPGTASSDTERQQLVREARAASQLDHPNIGIVHGVEKSDDGQWFIVMAFYEGVTLERKLGRISTAQALDVAAQVARGLAEAHAHHLIHRDIKPSNIILTENGTAKIVDFGIARPAPTVTETLSVGAKGTTAYMSPEQLLGNGADHRSDIWSLGVVLAETLTGHHPFGGENIGAKVFAIVNEAPQKLDGIPAATQAIVYRALAKNPADRYQSCAEMAADLESAKALLEPHYHAPGDHVSPARVKHLEKYIHNASTPTSAIGGQSRWHKWQTAAAVLVLGVVVGLFAVPPAVHWIRDRWFGPPEKHIAVLPFDVIGDDPAVVPLAEGLVDSLTSKLSNLDTGQQSLWVVPASVVRRQKVDDPRSALRDLGATLVVKGSIQRSGPSVRLIVNLISTRPVRQLASADFQDSSGDFSSLQERAMEHLTRVMRVSTSAVAPEPGGSNVAAAYESYLKALGYMQRYDRAGNLDNAIEELRSATKRDPNFALGFAQLGEAYRMKYKVEKEPKWIDESVTSCRKALAISDYLPRAYVTLGRIHSDTGKNDLAIQEFQQALKSDARNADALIGLAHAYESANNLADAEATYQKAAAMRPDYWDGYNVLGLFYDRQRRYPEAIQQLKKVVELTPDNRNAYLNLAAVYLDTNDPKYVGDAEAALKHSIELAPSYAAYGNLAFMYLQQKRYAESAAMSEKATEMNDKNRVVWSNLALASEWLGDAAKADAAHEHELQLTERDAKANPQDGQLQASLADLYARKHDRDAALSHAKSAIALAPDDPDVLCELGIAYEYLGDRTKAIEYLHQALSKGKNIADLERAASLRNLLADPNFRTKK
jgi:serine/threonine-protein kinase